MAIRKSKVLLPELFQTTKNNKFLNATVDQLISEPNLERVNSYIGKKFSLNYSIGDSYVSEIDENRQNYQLEPAVVYRNANDQIESVSTYIDFINSLNYNGVNTNTHSNLFEQDYYNYSGFIDFDKIVNYGEYFWLPAGPDSVQVFNGLVAIEHDYTISRSLISGITQYTIDSSSNTNPTLVLARGGNYTFNVDQEEHSFWIQTEPGTSGIKASQKSISTREIFGITNNGEDVGTITFNVPDKDAQNDLLFATEADTPDFATELFYTDIHNANYTDFIDTYGGIDTLTSIDGKTIVFVNTTLDETKWSGLSLEDRYAVFKITVASDTITLLKISDWPKLQKVKIKQGTTYSNREFFKNASGYPELIPPYTANLDTLYYQDGTNANQFGIIKIVDSEIINPINIADEILGKDNYTSQNGVTFTNGLKVQFDSNVSPETYANNEYFVEGIGQPGGIKLVAVTDLVTPETYTITTSEGYDAKSYDVGGFDGTLNAPTNQDYIVINRSSPDLNAWSRTNRWFHRQVIEKTALYNNYILEIDDSARATRPIIEFVSGLELYNMGTSAISPVTVVDTEQTDALSNVNGSTGYFADGIDLKSGNTIIFSSDLNESVRKTVYRIDFIDQDNDIETSEIINLVAIDTVEDTNTVLSSLGSSNQGKQFWLDSGVWKLAQQKTKLNQDPLFNIYDPDHVSFGDTTKYPSSNFSGNKLFSYKRNLDTSPDSILGFGLTYRNFSTIGDIVFENNFSTNTFQYTKTTGNVDVIIQSGHAHIFDDSGNRTLSNGWTKVIETSIQHQIKSFTVNTELYSFEIGAPVDTTKIRQPLQVYVNGSFVKPTEYTHLIQSDREYVVFDTARNPNDVVTIKFFSNIKANGSYYEIPDNLQNNSNNENFETLTLGQIRNHCSEISKQIKNFNGNSPGSSNIRDLDYKKYPGNILQHSAGTTIPMYLMTNTEYGTVQSIKFVKDEYTRFKNRFIDNIDKLDLDLTNPKESVDKIIEFMIGKKTSVFPFYYSDMLPYGSQKSTVTHVIDEITETDFEFNTKFDLLELSNRSVLVYKNQTLLVEGQDYTFDNSEAKIVLTSNVVLDVNDTITIEEYENTDGSFVPPTPSKLGLYPKTFPSKYIDSTYVNDKVVIQGHDGSIYIGFGDLRDDILLEYEKRVYNNIKTQYQSNLFDYSDVLPGYFRSTITDLNETNNLIRSYFGQWALKNKIKIENTYFDTTNKFTWNYNNSVNKLDDSRLPGHWRGIYQWMYDTDRPHTHPWEMLGIFEKPSWWDTRYGVAPYTSGNTVLWEDLQAGKLYNDGTGTTYTTLTNRQRPRLLEVLPVNAQGELKAPADFLVKGAFVTNTQDNFTFSDLSPAENAWRRSSEWPYVVQILAANLKPAKYGSLMFDTNLYVKDNSYDQILQNGKSYRPSKADYFIHGSVHSGSIKRVEGYNQFIAEFAKYNSFNINDIETRIQNLDLNLSYAIAGFTNKNYFKISAESISPGSESENIFIPDENVSVYTKKSVPLERVNYSGVQIIKRPAGYEILGYDTENPFFKIIPSITGPDANQVVVGETTYFEFKDFENRILNIPYGTIIKTKQQVFDFLVSYQRYLLSRGFVFDGTTGNGLANDFVAAGKEFAFWTDQNWANNSVIVLSPYYNTLKINRAYSTVDDLTGKLKNSNNEIIKSKYYDVSREDNLVTIEVDINNSNLYSVQVDPIQYEHVLVFSNKTIFNDIIYQPELGNRQERLKFIGSKSGDWTGTLSAAGFFLADDKVDFWQSYVDYNRGDIVNYQNTNYVAKVNHAGSSVFNYEHWQIADNIQTGMIKNLTSKAKDFTKFYEIDDLNLEQSIDLLGKGTIGFNRKSYLEGLGLDDISQVKFYQGLIKNKGTSGSIEKLINAELTNLDQDIKLYEEWAFRVGEYGSVDSNQVIEVVVPENTVTDNPSIITFRNNGEISSLVNPIGLQIDQKGLYKTPNNYTSSIIGKRTSNSDLKMDLDTAGPVRLDDIDFTAFSIDNLSDLNNRINEFGKGKRIWVGSNLFDWDVLRVDEINTNITDIVSTVNGFLIFTTDKNHGLVKNDYVVIKLNQPLGGIFKITSVDTPNTFTVELSSVEAEIENVNVQFYKLTSVRFAQPSDLVSYTPNNGWAENELIWVDKNSNNNWTVLKNTKPWTTTGIKPVSGLTTNENFGKSVALNNDASLSIVGAPDRGTGVLIPYVRSVDGPLSEKNSITYDTKSSSIDSFGFSVAAGQSYVAAGAPGTYGSRGSVHPFLVDINGNFNKLPSLHPSTLNINDKFGYSITMTGNGRHLFVGAPGDNKVYAYTLVEISSGLVKVDTVTGDGGTNYTLAYTPISSESIHVVDELGKVYLPNKDWTLSGNTITFTSTVAAGFQVVVRQLDYFALVDTFSAGTGEFGKSIDSDYIGRKIIVGAPSATIGGKANSGEAYVYGQHVEAFVANGSNRVFTTENTLQTKIFVEVNGILQTETDNSEIGTDNDESSILFYTRIGNTITFKYTPSAGSIIKIYTGSFSQIQQIDQLDITGETTSGDENFGESVAIDSKGSIVAIGAPGEDEINPDTGSVFILQDEGKNYGEVTSSATSYSQTSGDTIYIDDRKITVSTTSNDPADLALDINAADIPGVSASGSSGNLVINSTNTSIFNKLTVHPGTGSTFITGAAVNPYKFTQKINHPIGYENENFGKALAFDKHVNLDSSLDKRNLVIGSEKASTFISTVFDIETNTSLENYNRANTTFDIQSTNFVDRKVQSGAAYVFEVLSASNESISNPSKLAYSQQLTSSNINELDQFGFSIAYNNERIFIGAPNDNTTVSNSGSVYEFNNSGNLSGWIPHRNEAQKVDINLVNRVALYNKKTGSIIQYLDYLDHAKGKIAGIAKSELNFITNVDPASYTGSNWTFNQNNKLWWDTSTVHYLNYEQGNNEFRKTYWNTSFPGSTIDVYEWIESSVPPSQYLGEGTVKDVNLFNTADVFDSTSNKVRTLYYFWVKGRTDVPSAAEFRNISASRVEQIIENPKAQGIPFVAFIDSDTVALFNVSRYLADSDIVLSINYDVVKNDGILHSEFELFGKGNTDQKIPARIFDKLKSSLAGADSLGNIVPDPLLSEIEKYGVLNKPRQGLFVNNRSALKVLVQYVNSVFVKNPFARTIDLTKLLSSESIPTINSNEYDITVSSVNERDFLNTAILNTGYKVLVLEDENNNNYWSIYKLTVDKNWELERIQSYNTQDYWKYITYYATGYDSTTLPKYQVTTENDLLTLTQAVEGDLAKVTNNDDGNFSIFCKKGTAWDEVVIEKGTIELSAGLYDYALSNNTSQPTGFDNGGFDFSAWDKVPTQEIRQIVDALNEDIFVGEYKINMNELFFRLMEYAVNETNYTQDWMFKTSFITIDHKLRNLEQFKTFKFDNTTFIEDFINEVKPYKTKIREYVSKYDNTDLFQGDTTDFDIHSFYDTNLQLFRKPSGDYVGDNALLSQGLNVPWNENYGYSIDELVINAAGTGFISNPSITISSPDLSNGIQATATAISNGDSIIDVRITNKGSGYTKNPSITISGTGTGLQLSPRMTNKTTRSFDTTIKFDRITYSSNIKDWTADTAYSENDLVAYKNSATGVQEVYLVSASFTSGSTFSVEDTTGAQVMSVYADENFTNNADRIAAYYTSKTGELGDDLEMLQLGTGYPSNKLNGPGFDQEPGFDQSNFDIGGFDNFEIDSDGLTVLAGLDTNITSTFIDTALGTRPEDINVDGGEFVDTYNSHAPEELVPGRVYDTLDMEVYTDPSDDYENDGNASLVKYISFSGIGKTTFSFGDETKSVDDYEYFVVYRNQSREYSFTIDYNTKSLTIPTALSATDILHIYAYSSTGEKTSGEFTLEGDGSTVSFLVGVNFEQAKQVLVLVDGVVTNTTNTSVDNRTNILFSSPPANGSHIHVYTYNQDISRTAPSEFKLQTTSMTSGTYVYSLDNIVEYAQPFSANTIVEVDNVRLRPANSIYHTANGIDTEFDICRTADETFINSPNDIGVAVINTDGTTTNMILNVDYTALTATSYVTLTEAPEENSTVIVYNRQDAEYFISNNGQEIQIMSSVSFSSSSILRINTFSNHDSQRIQTKVYKGYGAGTVNNSSYILDRSASNMNNFWITIDGQRLHPGDFTVDGTNTLRLSDNAETSVGTNSIIVITSFSENSIQPTIGFRIFQDMNGNIEYLRLCKDATAKVSAVVLPTDDKIYIDDISKLPFITPQSKYPGVIFIGGERITYWEVSLEDNYITGLRRATQGTAMIQRIEPGYLVVDAGKDQLLPSTNTHTNTWYTVGSSSAANGLGLQSSSTSNANFLKACEAEVPSYKAELDAKDYVAEGYVAEGYIEVKP